MDQQISWMDVFGMNQSFGDPADRRSESDKLPPCPGCGGVGRGNGGGGGVSADMMTPPYQSYWAAWLRSLDLDDEHDHPWAGHEPWRYIGWINGQWCSFRQAAGYRSHHEMEMQPGYLERFGAWLEAKYPRVSTSVAHRSLDEVSFLAATGGME
jgi:hypothetical protein